MLTHNNIVIFSHPRTGTKSLAKIIESFGYHNCGEWYALNSTYLDNNRAVRRKTHITPIISAPENQYKKLIEHMRRYSLYNKVGKTVITLWPSSLLEFPFMLAEYDDYHWVCIRRDPWEQLLSWNISLVNKNFDGLFDSSPILCKEETFRKSYWDYYTTIELQDLVVRTKSSTLLDFNELITGNAIALGKNYTVTSKDEHLNLEAFVTNIDDVRGWFNALEQNRLSNMNYYRN